MTEGKILQPMLVGKVKKEVKHQKIGGKKIVIERVFNSTEILDTPIDEMTIACINFVTRRIPLKDNMIVYYGHVNRLGYFIAEDELDGPLKVATNKDFKEVW